MINILEIRANPISRSNGIVKYCDELREMLVGDKEINIFPVENYPMKRDRFLKERFTSAFFDKAIQEADIVHINGYAAFIVFQSILSSVRHKKKIVYTPHWHPFKYLSHPKRGELFFNVLIKPLVRRYVDVVITLNDEDTAFFSSFHDNVVRIPHWISFNIEDNNEIKKDPNMILFVGRLTDENKGVDHLFHLPEGKYNIHCVGAGQRSLRSDMTHHENISDAELRELYLKASLLVVPSRYEAFSYVSLESLCYKTPVLLSDRVRIYDYLHGVTGVDCFRYKNYKEFCQKTDILIGSEVDVKSVSTLFSKESIRQKYKELFNKVIKI